MLRQEGLDTFRAFCGSQPDLGGKDFAKLCRDCHLIGNRLAPGDVDIIFAKVVQKGQRRINLQQFEEALRMVAEKKCMDVCDVCRAVEQSAGPVLRGTRANPVRFHDDKSTYTGTHIHGGPTTGPKGEGTSIRREWLQTMVPDGAESEASLDSPSRRSETCSAQRIFRHFADECIAVPAVLYSWGEAVEATFKAYCGPHPVLDGKSFLKLCKDCHLIDNKALSATDADLLFAELLPKGHRRLDLRWFKHAMWHIAERRGVDVEVVYYAISMRSGPILHGTKASPVRFHDDKTTYTGTHVHGGPDVGPIRKTLPANDVWRAQLRPEPRAGFERGKAFSFAVETPSRHRVSTAQLHRHSI